ncbi:unnamed protein product [Dovyalis caffra]|uniref:tRNA pseudouridine synthase n=1 Tax=Dovyalis caffra TaxID=77055 RepID=A0AAV1S6W8_9ROSI|nr:unnamed protein product [Dovyalis caffra]
MPGYDKRIMNHHPRRYIALKVMYFGQRFYGFASEAQMEPTVESEIFKALEKTRLSIGDKKEIQYSRCGRTDKGVSAVGQVIALYLRSKLKDDDMHNKHSGETVPEEQDGQPEGEIDYVRVLNGVLPKDIRIVMESAGKKFIGEHDFRNFCKMDAVNVHNHRRHVTSFEISPCDMSDTSGMGSIGWMIRKLSIRTKFKGHQLCAIKIKGSAFLWHQVRCMVAVLFMIGQGLESPENIKSEQDEHTQDGSEQSTDGGDHFEATFGRYWYTVVSMRNPLRYFESQLRWAIKSTGCFIGIVIDALLDTQRTPRKPQYLMAPEIPLVLLSCEFEGLKFACSSDAGQALHVHLENECRLYQLQAAIYHEALLSRLPLPNDKDWSSNGVIRKKASHVPLISRITERESCHTSNVIIDLLERWNTVEGCLQIFKIRGQRSKKEIGPMVKSFDQLFWAASGANHRTQTQAMAVSQLFALDTYAVVASNQLLIVYITDGVRWN